MKTILSLRMQKYLARISVFLILIALIAGMVGCGGNDYNPPLSQNLEIYDWYDLDAIRNNLGGNHTLMNDLDSTTLGYEELVSPTANGGKGWQPIGETIGSSFIGSFDGQGHEIHDLFINRPDEDLVGLFGRVGVGVVVKYIGVVNVDITGNDMVGGLIGHNYEGTVSNSYSTGSVTGNGDVGGLVGENGNISNSYSTVNVIGYYDVGGLVGGLWEDTVSNCYSTGNVTGYEYVGGLVGYIIRSTVSNSYSTGSVTGNTSVGGLVGVHYGTVTYSFWDTETSGQATSGGGTGKNTAEMQDIDTFTDTETEGLDEPWDIIAVANSGTRNPSYVWNIVDDETYPFLSWEPVL